MTCWYCGAALRNPRARYCSDQCRWTGKALGNRPFTEEETAQFYADALAGRIEGWNVPENSGEQDLRRS